MQAVRTGLGACAAGAIHVAIDAELDGIRDAAESVRDRLVEAEERADAMLRNPLDVLSRPSDSR